MAINKNKIEISFVWWNTSLSPVTKKDRATNDELDVALAMIDMFITKLNIDCICLAEVSLGDIEKIKKLSALRDYEILSGVNPIGRTSFDTCIIYNTLKFSIYDSSDIISIKGNSTLKVAQRIDLFCRIDGNIFNLFVSHWPSRIWCEENNADRHFLGVRLRDAIETTKNENSIGNVIIAGDFNDEPFDKSISNQLMATRDLILAKDSNHLLYNPFWRYMSNYYFYSKEISCHTLNGTYYRKNDSINRWRTFDQVIVSTAFLGKGDWHLIEKKAKIINNQEYLDVVLNSNTIFDHMPIMIAIERNP